MSSKSQHNQADLNFGLKTKNGENVSLGGMITMSKDKTEPQNIKSAVDFGITLAVEDKEFLLKGKSIALGKTYYLKLSTIPELLRRELKIDILKLKNQWIRYDSGFYKDYIKKIIGDEWSPEIEIETEIEKEIEKPLRIIQEKIKNLIKNRELYFSKEELPDEELKGQINHHYIVALNKTSSKRL